MVIKMLSELRRKDEHSENFNKETGNIRKYQIEVTELKNTITELRNILEGFNRRLDAEERISQLKNKAVELTQ